MDDKDVFPAETDQATAEVFEQQQRELDKYKTRYVYVPLRDAACPQIEGGYVPAGVIHPIPAPRGKINVKLLPDGAQVLYVTSPSVGVRRGATERRTHSDPEIQALIDEVERMKQDMLDRGQEPPNIAIYLHEVWPILSSITSTYGHQGAIEVKALSGMPAPAFKKHGINDHLFGPAEDRAKTATGIRARMLAVVEQGNGQKGTAAQILTRVAHEVIASAETCKQHCSEHVRRRHLELEDPQSDTPKRYSEGDLRAIEFIGATKRNEYLQQVAEQQQAAMSAIPQMLDMMRKRDEQFAATLGEMAKLLNAQTEALTAKK